MKVLILVLVFSPLLSCLENKSSSDHDDDTDPSYTQGRNKPVNVVSTFASHEDLVSYLRNLAKNSPRMDYSEDGPVATSAPAQVSDQAKSTNESITNNQEMGADEGGIVKNIGDYLVVLRKGQLYAAKTSSPLTQTGTMRVASTDQLNQGVWYDELLVKGNLLYVIGFRYAHVTNNPSPCYSGEVGMTEVNSFRLTPQGNFERLATRFFESSDYYSQSDYASRMMGGRLLLYLPVPAEKPCWRDDSVAVSMPHYFDNTESGFISSEEMFDGTQVYMPVEVMNYPILHTYVQCDLGDSGGMDCRARSFLADGRLTRYVTANAGYAYSDQVLYQFGLDDLTLTVHAARGRPHDRFSFKETSDHIDVFVTNEETSDIGIYHIPLGSFSDNPDQSLNNFYTNLSVGGGNNLAITSNRFIGKHLLWIQSEFSQQSGESLWSYDTESGDKKKLMDFEQGINSHRIEALIGERALVATTRFNGHPSLELRRLNLQHMVVSDPLILNNSQEGESRSHAFFAKAHGDGEIMGLPIIGNQSSASDWWGPGISNIVFFSGNDQAGLQVIGSVNSSGDTSVCQTSCVDWYGNSRPIFLKDQVFALMGNELVDLTIDSKEITTNSQIKLMP